MPINTKLIQALSLAKVTESIGQVMRIYDHGGDWKAPRVLLSEEARHIVRLQVRSSVVFRPERIGEYVTQFPEILQHQSSGGSLESEIESALVTAIEKPIMPLIGERLLEQFGGWRLENVLRELRQVADACRGDVRIAHAWSEFASAWTKLAEMPDHQSLSRMMFQIAAFADSVDEVGVLPFGERGKDRHDGGPYVLRLREAREFLDLSLENDGCDALLEEYAGATIRADGHR